MTKNPQSLGTFTPGDEANYEALRLAVSPGDILIIHGPKKLDDPQIEELREASNVLAARLEDQDVTVMLLPRGFTVTAANREQVRKMLGV